MPPCSRSTAQQTWQPGQHLPAHRAPCDTAARPASAAQRCGVWYCQRGTYRHQCIVPQVVAPPQRRVHLQEVAAVVATAGVVAERANKGRKQWAGRRACKTLQCFWQAHRTTPALGGHAARRGSHVAKQHGADGQALEEGLDTCRQPLDALAAGVGVQALQQVVATHWVWEKGRGSIVL